MGCQQIRSVEQKLCAPSPQFTDKYDWLKVNTSYLDHKQNFFFVESTSAMQGRDADATAAEVFWKWRCSGSGGVLEAEVGELHGWILQLAGSSVQSKVSTKCLCSTPRVT